MRRPPTTSVLVLGVLLLAASCTGGPPTTTTTTSTTVATTTTEPPPGPGDGALRTVPATAPGEGASPAFGDHVVGAPAGSVRDELLVFFPGTGAEPGWYSTFLQHALDAGYHVVGLAYPNDRSVNFDLCPGNPDPACAESAREELLFGIDAPGLPDLDVPAEDAAVRRLEDLLAHLAGVRPDEGWDDVLAGGEVRWDRVATGGHSQGGGHAAYLGRSEVLVRVLLFDATEPAPWTSGPMATPGERMWGLAHSSEPIVAPIQRSWDQLRLPGPVVDVDSGPAPWGGSHRLVTSTDECRGDPASRGFHHNCPVLDAGLPDPLPASLEAAWTTMLTA